jgi:hypothetical protein
MTILTGWREQFERLQRSHARLSAIANGREFASSDEARDALVRFFQDGWHLKDWIANDPAANVDSAAVEAHVGNTQVLMLCADVANGTKHLGLDPKYRPRTGDVATALTSQDVTVRPAPAGSRTLPRPALHAWCVTSGGQQYDAVPLAGDVVREWRQWLELKGLL